MSDQRDPSSEAGSTSVEQVSERMPTDEHALMNLAQVLAHRLRGLVSSIEGYTDLLTDTLGTREQREMALRIFESATNIERILADLQRYSQPVEPVLRLLRIQTVVNDVLVMLDEADVGRITVELDGDRDLNADPVLLRQALLVLIQNALDATRPTGGVHVNVELDENHVYFNVLNEGTIDLDDPTAAVFEPFFTTKAHNLGVGLSMARRIAVEHGGDVYLNDSPSGTTCFTLSLPL